MSAAVRWLRADVREVVRIVPEGRGQHPGPAASGLDESLARWGARLGRRRAIVLVRRHFLVAATIVVGAELVAILLGHGHRPLWLIAPLLLALVGGGVVLARGVPEAQAARMLDRGLDLHERLETALEIEAATPAPVGLAALVVDEANAALGKSLVTARAAGRPSRPEWAWGLAGVVALAVAVAVPGVGPSGTTPHGAAVGGPSTNTGVHRAANGRGKAGGSAAAPSSSPSGAPKLPRAPSLTAGIVNTSPHSAPNNGYSLYGKGGHMTPAQLAQLAHEGLASGTGARVASVGGSPPQAGAGASGGAGGASSSSVLGGQSSVSNASTGGALPPPTATASAQSGAAQAGGHRGSSPGQAGASASAGSGSGRSAGAAPSGGNTAGATRAALNLGLGLVPELKGGSRLPLQAEFAPTGSNHSAGHEGISQSPNGGGGPGRTTTGGGGIGGAGGFGTGFAVIPPTFNSAPTAVEGLLQGYFGVADQLEFNGW
jgi:hypothetical protein